MTLRGGPCVFCSEHFTPKWVNSQLYLFCSYLYQPLPREMFYVTHFTKYVNIKNINHQYIFNFSALDLSEIINYDLIYPHPITDRTTYLKCRLRKTTNLPQFYFAGILKARWSKNTHIYLSHKDIITLSSIFEPQKMDNITYRQMDSLIMRIDKCFIRYIQQITFIFSHRRKRLK